MTSEWDAIEAGQKWTFSNDGQTHELLHIEVPFSLVGSEGSFRPPAPDVGSLGNWVRSGYFIKPSSVVAQLPRNSVLMPGEAGGGNLSLVVLTEPELRVVFQYDDGSLVLFWNVETDTWDREWYDSDEGAVERLHSSAERVLWQL